ncbi:hypothetical protein ACFSQ7_30195 [Paenibacillus rhizoplanae]
MGVYEPFHIMLNNYGIADIVLTRHAKSRYADRVAAEDSGKVEVTAWIWQALKQNRLKPYSNSDYNAYLIDNDTVIVVDFRQLEGVTTLSGEPLYVMVIVSFLGKNIGDSAAPGSQKVLFLAAPYPAHEAVQETPQAQVRYFERGRHAA